MTGLQQTSPGQHVLLPQRTGRSIFGFPEADEETEADAETEADTGAEVDAIVAVALAGGSGSAGARFAHAIGTPSTATPTTSHARTTALRGRTRSDGPP